jgi:GTP cyclohydrolase III
VEVTTSALRGHVYRIVDVEDEPGRAPTPEEAAVAAKHAPFEHAQTARRRDRLRAEAEAAAASAPEPMIAP